MSRQQAHTLSSYATEIKSLTDKLVWYNTIRFVTNHSKLRLLRIILLMIVENRT